MQRVLLAVSGVLLLGVLLVHQHLQERERRARWRQIEANAALARNANARAEDAAFQELIEREPSGPDDFVVLSRGFVLIRHADGRETRENVPASPRGYGEQPHACWLAPDGTLYVVGTHYRKAVGNDGVVWKRTAQGEWSTPFVLERQPLTSIDGRSPTDVHVAGVTGRARFDGHVWIRDQAPSTTAPADGGTCAHGGTSIDVMATTGMASPESLREPREQQLRDEHAREVEQLRKMI